MSTVMSKNSQSTDDLVPKNVNKKKFLTIDHQGSRLKSRMKTMEKNNVHLANKMNTKIQNLPDK